MKIFFLPFIYLLLISNVCISQANNNNNDIKQRIIDANRFTVHPDFKSISNQTLNGKRKFSNYSSTEGVGKISVNNLQKIVTSACFDTSGRFLLNRDSTNLYVGDFIKDDNDNLFIVGEYVDYKGGIFKEKGFMLKTDTKGNVEWFKTYDSANKTMYNYIYYYRIIKLLDGDFLLAGSTNNTVTQNDDLILTKVTATGNLVWSKTYKSRLWGIGNGSTDYFYVQQMKQDPFTGDIFVIGPSWNNGRNLIKLSITNGAIFWSKFYDPFSDGIFENLFGLDIKQNELISFGRFFTYYAGSPLAIYRINKITGDTIQTKFYNVDEDTNSVKLSYLAPFPLQKLNNGNYVLSGRLQGEFVYQYDGTTPLYQAGVTIIDTNLSILNSFCFRNSVESNGYNTLVTVYPDNTGVFTMLNFWGGYSGGVYITNFANGSIVRQRKIASQNSGIPIENRFVKLSNGADLTIRLKGDSINHMSHIEFVQMHLSDTASDCLGQYNNETFTQSYSYKPLPQFSIDSIGSNVFFESTNKTLIVENDSFDHLFPGCNNTSYCDSLKLETSSATTCPSLPILITAHKNNQCGSGILFNIDSTHVQSFIQINDSVYALTFNGAWQGKLYGSIASCNELKDSLAITVLASPSFINLGPDTSICTGNSILLNARRGFATYKWQDGSTDSTFTVTTPGTYYVDVTGACGNTLSDTVHVVPFNFSFFIGNDTLRCNKDTITLTATAGLSNYQWQPNYNINNTTQSIVKVYPAMDTAYYATAQVRPGCIVKDTVHITVKSSPPIQLGADTSLCIGNTLILDAGSGFANYQWNTGDVTQQITVGAVGNYVVKATAANTCISSDTLSILYVSPLPIFTLGVDTILCTGKQYTYAFNLPNATYLWQDGNTNGNYTINSAGEYRLAVTQLGCSAKDTVNIFYKETPIVHIGIDSNLCVGNSYLLNAFYPTATYTWQDGSLNPTFLVTQPGLYYVINSLSNNCTFSDSVFITYTNKPIFNLGADTSVCSSRPITLSPLLNVEGNYLWQDGSTQKSYTIKRQGIYSLTVTNTCGSYKDAIVISDAACELLMPNSFTPNGDGLNDVFKIKYPFKALEFTFSIYNKYGTKIFETIDMLKGWDGTYQAKKQEMGTYVWAIKIKNLNGYIEELNGTVILLR